MSKKRPYVLSIAGLDPSGGAGLLADVKTFEAHKAHGLAVCSALTWQNDINFKKVQWVPVEDIMEQADLLWDRFTIDYVKIGLIENWQTLHRLAQYLKTKNPKVKIVLDPVLKASAGFVFHDQIKEENFFEILESIFLITPNWDEAKILYPDEEPLEGSKALSKYCHVFLKGGHHQKNPGKDYLFHKDKSYPFNPKKVVKYPKHGSGCVLSSAITAQLARGYKLHKACLKAKAYVTWFLDSNESMLGYHKM